MNRGYKIPTTAFLASQLKSELFLFWMFLNTWYKFHTDVQSKLLFISRRSIGSIKTFYECAFVWCMSRNSRCRTKNKHIQSSKWQIGLPKGQVKSKVAAAGAIKGKILYPKIAEIHMQYVLFLLVQRLRQNNYYFKISCLFALNVNQNL